MKIIEKLEWDSDFFGFNVAQIKGKRINEKKMTSIKKFCKNNKIDLLQFKCDAHHRPSILLAEKNSFHFADSRMTYLLNLEKTKKIYIKNDKDLSFRLAVPRDAKKLDKIVSELYKDSRYYFDINFPRKDVKNFYSDWINKSIIGKFDDMVWLLLYKNKLIGCCSLKINSRKYASIGLFGIEKKFTGKGYGRFLIKKIIYFLNKQKIKKIFVVTQGRNYRAQNLYQKTGFSINSMEIYYHCWFYKKNK